VREHPEAYPCVRGDARRASLDLFPYSVIYIPAEAAIVVLACFHASRDPREWERRIPDAPVEPPDRS